MHSETHAIFNLMGMSPSFRKQQPRRACRRMPAAANFALHRTHAPTNTPTTTTSSLTVKSV